MQRTLFSQGRLAAMIALSALSFTACTNDSSPVSSPTSSLSGGKYAQIEADTYANFAELDAAEPNSYTIATRNINTSDTVASRTIIFTPHGGGIEPGATEIADAISNASTGPDYDFYSFTGVKSSNNSTLHITSTNFDEPTCETMVEATNRTISIHGCSGATAIVYVSGLDTNLRNAIANELTDAGFTVSTTPPSHLAGTSANNISNRNSVGRGVQMELSKALREQMMTSLSTASGRASSKTTTFYNFVNAVREALAQ